MEVGPLNPVDPLVPGAKESRDGQTKKVEKSHTPSKTNRPSGPRKADTVDIANRATDVKDLQRKFGVSNTARKAIETLIKDLSRSTGKLNAEHVKAAAKKAASAKFNGKDVFNGKTLTHKSRDGSNHKVDVPSKKGLVEWAVTSLEDYLKGKKPEAAAFKALNKRTDDISKFSNAVKDDLKAAVGTSNKTASKSGSRNMKAVRKAVQHFAAKTGKYGKKTPSPQMVSKAVRLLK